MKQREGKSGEGERKERRGDRREGEKQMET